MTRILLLENPHEVADETFGKYGVEITRISGSLDEDELIDALDGVDMLGIRSKTQVTQRVLEARPQLAAIGAFCIGTNQIDLTASSEAGVAVFNAPYSNTRSVVELAVSHIISLIRHVPERNASLQRGIWQKSANGSHEIRGKTLGIIGYGSIGSQLSVVAEALGMRVIFVDLAEKLALGNARQVSLDELLQTADFVTIHVDGRPSNQNFFTAAMFDKMKNGSIFINLSRGFVVDLGALRAHIEDGSIAGAAIDVYPTEPKKNGDPFESELIGLDNVILTPHIGGSTLEAQESIGRFVSSKLMNYWRKAETDMSVNLPNIASSPSEEAVHRVGWVHRNTPGALARVNLLFAEAGMNVTHQQLATSGEYGYMVTDTSSEVDESIVTKLSSAPSHIRMRIVHRDH